MVAHAANLADLIGDANKSFREQKSGDKLFVVARRAHRQRESAPAQADLERFLDRDNLSPAIGYAAAPSPRLPRKGSIAVRIAHDGRVSSRRVCCVYPDNR